LTYCSLDARWWTCYDAFMNSQANLILDTIVKRRSTRAFSNAVITSDIQERLITATMFYPSAYNFRPLELIMVENTALRQSIADSSPYASPAAKAQLCMLLCADMSRVSRDPQWWTQDLSAATQNLMIQAQAEGLASVWLGIYPEQERVLAIQEIFSLPKNIVPFSVVALGYPETASLRVPSHENSSRVHRDSFSPKSLSSEGTQG